MNVYKSVSELIGKTPPSFPVCWELLREKWADISRPYLLKQNNKTAVRRCELQLFIDTYSCG